MDTENRFLAEFQSYQAQVETALQAYCKTIHTPSPLGQAMEYALTNGGKRLRPVLTLAFCKLYGGDVDKAMPFALATELIHSYSLVHDDLPAMDDDDLRRGKPSCHKKYDEATAILVGDALLTEAFSLMAQADLPAEQIVEGLSFLGKMAGATGMVGGQALECSFQDKKPTLADLQAIQQGKTGALLCGACFLGALVGGAVDKNPAITYGLKLGAAFQIRDDILDAIGDETKLGKPIGSDHKMGQETFYTLLGLEKAQALVEENSQEGKKTLNSMEENGFLLWLMDYLSQRNH